MVARNITVSCCLTLIFSAVAFAQVGTPLLIRQSAGSKTGEICLEERKPGKNKVCLAAADNLSADISMRWPDKAGVAGDCMVNLGGGVLDFASCDSLWTQTGSDIYRPTGLVGIGVVPTEALTIGGGAGNNVISLSHGTSGDVVQLIQGDGFTTFGTFSATPVFFAQDSVNRWVMDGWIWRPDVNVVASIGTQSFRPLIVYGRSADFTDPTPGLAYTKVQKLEIKDRSAGLGFWEITASAEGGLGASNLRIRDNSGSFAIELVRGFLGGLANDFNIYGNLIPRKRSIADGDSVDDAEFPSLGTISNPWYDIRGEAGYFDFFTVTGNASFGGNISIGAGSIIPGFSGFGSVGTSLYHIGQSHIDDGVFYGDLTVNGTCTGCSGEPFSDANALIKDNSDATKLARFELGGFSSGVTRVFTLPNANVTLAGTDLSQTFGNTQTFSNGIEFASSIGSKLMLFSSGGSNKYEIAVASADLRIIRDFSASKISFGYGHSGAYTESMFLDGNRLNIKGLFLTGTSNTVVVEGHLEPQTGGSFDIGNLLRWGNLKITTINSSGAIQADGGLSTASGTNSTIYINSGNFYLRTFSGGDASCGGVTNGWAGYRTDTNELQICNGGAVKKVSLL
jgi:hypothetical protein